MVISFEKIISSLFPKYALSRKVNSIKSNMLSRAYHAASQSKRLQHWITDSSSVNSDTYKSLDILRARSRDLIKNDGYGQRIVSAIQTNAVGTGITADIIRYGETDRKIQELWDKFADSTECDAEGKLNFYGIQSLIMREIVESGECLIRKFPKIYKKGEIPFELKIIEAELIDSTKDTSYFASKDENETIYQGIKFSNRGKRVGYYLKNDYDSSFVDSYFVDAKEILHCLRIDRASQARGIPWLTPVLLDLKQLADYQDTELVRRKIASCFTAFIHDIDGSNVGEQDDSEGEENNLKGEPMMPGIMEILPPGKTVTLSSPPNVIGYEEYCRSILKKISVGVGVSYEVLTSDLSQVNFSSARMGWIEFQRNLDSWRWNILVPMFCEPVFQWFLESINFIYGINTDGIKVTWTPPRREMIDPLKEVKADSLKVRNGFTSLDEIHREYGYNSAHVLKKIHDTNKIIDKYKISLDSDPRNTKENGGEKKRNDKKRT